VLKATKSSNYDNHLAKFSLKFIFYEIQLHLKFRVVSTGWY